MMKTTSKFSDIVQYKHKSIKLWQIDKEKNRIIDWKKM